MKTLAIANHKGGVGKTATAHALGAGLAILGRSVLLVDLDPQASLTGACGLADYEGPSMADVIGGAAPGRVAIRSILQHVALDEKHLTARDTSGLDLAPASIELAAAELGLVSRLGRETVLRKALATLAAAYDLVLIDCPPALSMLTINALAAADSVLIPTQPQAVDLRALRLFLETLDSMRAELNPGLKVLGILPTFYNAHLVHHVEALAAMTAAGLPVLPQAIGRSVRVAEAAAAGESIVTFAWDNPQAAAYRQLAERVDEWLSQKAS